MKKMTRVIALILSLAMFTSALTLCSAAATKSPFDDVSKKDWFYDYVLSLNADGIVNGKSKTTFAPNDNVTRAEFVKMLGAISMVNSKRFVPEGLTDVGEKDWFAGYVAWAMKVGVTKGTGKTTFAPNANITRQDMATMIYRFATENAVELKDGKAIAFKDAASIAKYAKNAVTAMQKAGIINGEKSGDGFVFNPADNATRAEAAKMLCVLFELVKDSERYQGYMTLKADLTEHANGKTEEGYPLFILKQGDDEKELFRIYISTENGVEQIHIARFIEATVSENEGLPDDIKPGDKGIMRFMFSLSAMGEDYQFIVKETIGNYYANIYLSGKCAELLGDKPMSFDGFDTNFMEDEFTEENVEDMKKSKIFVRQLAGTLDSMSPEGYLLRFGIDFGSVL